MKFKVIFVIHSWHCNKNLKSWYLEKFGHDMNLVWNICALSLSLPTKQRSYFMSECSAKFCNYTIRPKFLFKGHKFSLSKKYASVFISQCWKCCSLGFFLNTVRLMLENPTYLLNICISIFCVIEQLDITDNGIL